ncbi:sorting nexin-6 isoform X3 [Narcine bancroftii]|uniref:sorting nexin-6 isoform X3 n=1 Tax=Narcine bancroftii TaxID=1343680 RepID=UPI003831F7FF
MARTSSQKRTEDDLVENDQGEHQGVLYPQMCSKSKMERNEPLQTDLQQLLILQSRRVDVREELRESRPVNVDLQTDGTLQVDISDALSERDKVKFTVHTKSTLPNFKQDEFSVVRQHEEFVWLHDAFVENEEYAGYVIPPAPPKPDFDASRDKLQKLGEGEGSMTKEEFTKMKQELEAEYLAIFKKTVAMHEVFLCRVAAHPVLRNDLNFHVFLEYNQDLSIRGKNKKEKLEDFFKNVVKSADEVLVAGVKDVDDFFEHEKTFLLEYNNRIKDAAVKADKLTKSHKSVADDNSRISSIFYFLGTQDSTDLCKCMSLSNNVMWKYSLSSEQWEISIF